MHLRLHKKYFLWLTRLTEVYNMMNGNVSVYVILDNAKRQILATLQDIAKQAGVSIPTVSRILNPGGGPRAASTKTEKLVRGIFWNMFVISAIRIDNK